MSRLVELARRWLSSILLFSRIVIRRPLRNYQLAPAQAVIDSVLNRRGLEFAIMFPRQSGKNETQSQIEAYLLNLFQRVPGAEIVKAQPTFKPQAVNAIGRLTRALRNDWNRKHFATKEGYIVRLGEAQVVFFSADPASNPVGASATLLLECDETQDVLESEWDKKFVPMGASQNATIVYWGTAWTSRTLLAKTIARLQADERADGRRRVFIVTPEQVADENPDYGAFVANQVRKHGRQHPLIKTQYYNETIDDAGGMFPPARRALMQGHHPRQETPEPGKLYAALLDVAGADESAVGERTDSAALASSSKRDSTVLTIVEVDLATLDDGVLKAPTYRVAQRKRWIGTPHTALYAQLRALCETWQVQYLVADATGVGAGLVAFLEKAMRPGVVVPYVFNGSTKSALGWNFISVCDTGRFKEYAERPDDPDRDSVVFWEELEFCGYEVVPGPAHLLRWGVPDGTRNPATSHLVHDDTILSAALSAVLDSLPWHVDTGPTHIIRAPDPLDEMSRGF